MPNQTTLAEILATLEAEANPEACETMRGQYGIHSEHSFGVPMRRLLEIAKSAGTDHDLALDLWAHGSYEARTLAAMVDHPSEVTAAQMQAWCEAFDNWAIVDTVCFRLFDRCADAWTTVDEWVNDDRIFVRRAGFALIWALALHDRDAADQNFRTALGHARAGAHDERPLVGKAITMSMRAIATKRPALRDDVVALAQWLCDGKDPAARRVGRPIVRSFAAPGGQ